MSDDPIRDVAQWLLDNEVLAVWNQYRGGVNYCTACGVAVSLHEAPAPHGCGEAARKAGA